MPTMKQATTLKHRSNLGEGTLDVSFAAGEPVTILKEWQSSYLVKNGAGQLFNVPKHLIAPD
jgi:hypothetical protein